MTRARRRVKRASTPKDGRGASSARPPKGGKKPKKAPVSTQAERAPRQAPAPEGPTLKSQAQLEIRLGRGERALTPIEQAARLASAQMERRIGRLLSRRIKLKFR
jgi:hypothetical protein